jgi:hypothetical protein
METIRIARSGRRAQPRAPKGFAVAHGKSSKKAQENQCQPDETLRSGENSPTKTTATKKISAT